MLKSLTLKQITRYYANYRPQQVVERKKKFAKYQQILLYIY